MDYKDPRDYKAQQVQEFIQKMSQIESSGGKNTAHRELASGIHSGTAAVGEYGLMPLTAQDIDRQNHVNELTGLSKEEVQERLKADPDLARRLVETMASKLLNKNDKNTAAYKWQYGQNSKPSPEEVNNSPRVKKFKILGKNEKQ